MQTQTQTQTPALSKGKVIAAYKEPWYGEYDTKAVAIVHNMIRGVTPVPKGLKDLAALQKSLA